MSAPLNVVIPLGKLTKNMRSEGFHKPLQGTSLFGRPILFWIIDQLSLGDLDTIWLVISVADEALYQLYSTTRDEYECTGITGRVKLIPLRFPTRGVMETLAVAAKYMTDEHLDRTTVVLNGDTIFKFDILSVARTIKMCSDTPLCFLSRFEAKLIKYAEVNWLFCSIKEEPRDLCNTLPPGCRIHEISSTHTPRDRPVDGLVCLGAYAFSTGRQFRSICDEAVKCLDDDADTLSDFSFKALVTTALRMKTMHGFVIHPPESVLALKSREMLEEFIAAHGSNPEWRPAQAVRYAFEFSGGLFDKDGTPQHHVIYALQKLKTLGHHIVISSTLGRSSSEVKSLLCTLEEYEIEFNELEFHDAYRGETIKIGSNFVDARSDLCRTLGIVSTDTYEEQIEARHFNNVTMTENTVSKTSALQIVQGEATYYLHIPNELARFFPRLISSRSQDNEMSIEITRAPGVVCSRLMVNRYFNSRNLQTVLDGLAEIQVCVWMATAYSNLCSVHVCFPSIT